MTHFNKYITLHHHTWEEGWQREEQHFALIEIDYIKHLLNICLDGPETVMDVIGDTELGAQLQEVLDYFDQFAEVE